MASMRRNYCQMRVDQLIFQTTVCDANCYINANSHHSFLTGIFIQNRRVGTVVRHGFIPAIRPRRHQQPPPAGRRGRWIMDKLAPTGASISTVDDELHLITMQAANGADSWPLV